VEKTQNEHIKADFAELGSKALKRLFAANFFGTFTKFNTKTQDMHEQFDCYVIGLVGQQ
jgi:hypothetical protein